jgi:hypothetical protein
MNTDNHRYAALLALVWCANPVGAEETGTPRPDPIKSIVVTAARPAVADAELEINVGGD